MLRKMLNLVCLSLLCVPSVLAQSGRGRPADPPPPPPKSTPKPATGTERTPPPGTPASGKIPPGAALVEQGQAGLTTRYVLKNGLTLLISEEHSTPLVTVMALVKAGTVDEPETARGTARVTAEALTRGTTIRPGELWARQTAAAGGLPRTEVDATSTRFFLTGPVSGTTALIELVADALQHPAFSEEAIKKAMAASQRTIAAQSEAAETFSASRWLSVAYPQHPLGRPEATPEQLAVLKREAITQFHTSRYTPANTVICLTGDMIGPVVLKALQQQFGGWGGAATTAKLPEFEQKALQYQEERGATTASWVHLGYTVPVATAEEAVVWDVLRAVLGLGRGARLVQNLRDARGIVSDIRAQYTARRNLAQFVIGIRALPESIDRAEALSIEIVEHLRRERLSEGELQRAKSLLEKAFITEAETTEGQARVLARTETAAGFKAWSTYLSRLRQVTPEQIQTLAAKYLVVSKLSVHEYQSPSAPPRTFTPEKYAETVGLLVPLTTQLEIPSDAVRDAKQSFPVLKHGAIREVQQDVGKFIVMAQPEPVKDYSTLRGPKAFVRADPTRPLLTVGLYFQGGSTVEDETTSGITELMLRTMLRGTAKQPGDTLAAEMEQLGGEIRVVNEADFFGLELEILSRNGEDGLRRLIDMLENPAFDKDAVKRERDRLLADQLAARDAGAEQSFELAAKSLFPQHTYGLPKLGLAAGIAKLTETDLQKWHERTVKRQFPLAVIVGDTEGSALVSRVLSNGFVRNETDRAIKVRAADPATQPAELSGTTARPLSYVTWMWTAPAGRNATPPEWRALAEVLTTRLAQTAEGTATGPTFFEGRYQPRLQFSIFSISVGGTAGDEARLKTLLETSVKSLEQKPMDEEEWRGACRRAATYTAGDIESFQGRMRTYARYAFLGLPAAQVEQNIDDTLRIGRDAGNGALPSIVRSPSGRGVVRSTTK
ncbi:MAG: insulinase family protein [Blastocatellia bacterium]|nr:insulinase family protein [Blastocatellia bacterium]